jgi:hypothetical protein
MLSKTVIRGRNSLTISFRNAAGQLHRERGRPAVIKYSSDSIEYDYYVNGERSRPRMKGRDQPNSVVIKRGVNVYRYINVAERRNPSNDRPYGICLITDGNYEIRYLDRTIIGSPEFLYIETRNGRFITEYSLNYNNLGAYIMDSEYNRVNVPPELAKGYIPQIPRATITETPLSYFIV